MRNSRSTSSASSTRQPSYRRHKRGNAFVRLKGHNHYLGKADSPESWDRYCRVLAEYKINGQVTNARDSITVNQLLAAFLQHAEKHYRRSDGSKTRGRDNFLPVVSQLRDLYGESQVHDFGPRSLKAVREQFVARGCCRKYCNESVSKIRTIFRWGVAEELVDVTILQALEAVAPLLEGRTDAREAPPVLPVPEDIIEKTLPFLPEIVRDMVQIQLLTAMRPAEVCKLRHDELNCDQSPWVFRPKSHKTAHKGRERIVYLGPKAQAILVRYLQVEAGGYCFSPMRSESIQRRMKSKRRKTPLSCGNSVVVGTKTPRRDFGDYYSTASYRRAIHRACDKAFPPPKNLDRHAKRKWISEHRWAPNQIRHLQATKIRSKFGLEHAQAILGHARADITQVYAERDLEKARQVILAIG